MNIHDNTYSSYSKKLTLLSQAVTTADSCVPHVPAQAEESPALSNDKHMFSTAE